MQSEPNRNPQENYTILRIKRKRNEEPLDALVIESRSRRKKTKGGDDPNMSVFQFAETVEPGAWDDEKQKLELETRISALAREKARKDVPPAPEPDVATETSQPTAVAEASPVLPPSSPAPKPHARAATPAQPSPLAPANRSFPRVEDPARKYTIIPSQSPSLRPTPSTEWERRRKPRLMAPPKVHSYKELERATFTLYDAVPSSSSLASMASPIPATPDKMDIDPEVAKFLPMLQDYLKINGDSEALTPAPSMNDLSKQQEDEEDYVYDVFYSRPASMRDLYGADGLRAIGTVTGLPEDDLYASSDDSDLDDEDDEDSNAEDWYKNDYPEEEDERSQWGEDDDSDEFHEHSDFDDVVHGGVEGIRGWWALNDADSGDF